MPSRPLSPRILLAAVLSACAAHAATEIALSSTGAGAQRWKDAAHTLYAESYRTTYTYDQATVAVSHEPYAETFVGQLTATNLKPNFAYQIKLEAAPGAACAERLGSVGRYWREEWSGGAWANDGNLNEKGNGTSPNPNDISYLACRDEQAGSPTGLRYRFAMYLLLGYIITDSDGNATVELRMDSSYHVLWHEDQRTRVASDGPVVSQTFAPRAASPAYDSDGAEQTVGVFAEWERLPTGGLRLPDGDYDLKLVLTEESFHHDDDHDGWWPTVMCGQLSFTVGPLPYFTTQPQPLVVHTGDPVQFAVATGGGEVSLLWQKDGETIDGEQSATLDLGAAAAGDAGIYVCVATNGAGTTASRAAALLVRDDLYTEAEYTQAVTERDETIAQLRAQVAAMYTAAQVTAAIEEARPDRDGDGYTDAQELERETDPDSYTLTVKPGWNLVSLARVPEDSTVQCVFGESLRGAVGHAWRWNPETLRYETTDCLEPLQGQWLYWDGEETEIEIHLPEHGAER